MNNLASTPAASLGQKSLALPQDTASDRREPPAATRMSGMYVCKSGVTVQFRSNQKERETESTNLNMQGLHDEESA